ncbi:AraC family transcriptional regulator [Hominifimenecus sp. rT4P-3]|uniref:AraC family transcriptional regulator n=1 Tax=Hominifimenecus sp. rT4P-3 TaxID=3242979 RepID=UPI003DA1D824
MSNHILATCRHLVFSLCNAIPNSHPCWEFMYILHGSCEFSCGLAKETLYAGDLCIIAPHTIHMFNHQEEHTDILNLLLSADSVSTENIPAEARYFCGSYQTYLPFLCNGLELMESESWGSKEQKELMQYHQVQLFCILFQDILKKNLCHFHRFEQNTLVSEVFAYVKAHYNDDISLIQLSKKYFISPSYLNKLFRKYANVPPFEAIIRCRLYQAALRLVDTQESIQQIAFQCGYNNVAVFTKLFTQRNHCSPREYRRRYSRLFQKEIYSSPSQDYDVLLKRRIL